MAYLENLTSSHGQANGIILYVVRVGRSPACRAFVVSLIDSVDSIVSVSIPREILENLRTLLSIPLAPPRLRTL
jgi:hypothetical protein